MDVKHTHTHRHFRLSALYKNIISHCMEGSLARGFSRSHYQSPPMTITALGFIFMWPLLITNPKQSQKEAFRKQGSTVITGNCLGNADPNPSAPPGPCKKEAMSCEP